MQAKLARIWLGKPHPQKKRVYLGIAQIAVWPPLLRKSGHLWHNVFAENEKIL